MRITDRARTCVVACTVLLLAGVFAAVPVSATVYTVALKNGTTFDTRYQPEVASWDANKVVLMTEYGNRVALAVGEIDSVTVDSESRGFGHQLNASTIALGWAPNDALDPGSDEGKAAIAAQAAADASGQQAQAIYNQQQFIEPGSTSGLPVWMTGINAVPQVQPSGVQPSPAP
ncbi:MAG: hypothetical protein ABIV06_08120 [Thermoanaerobaculia bacterium]